MPLPSPVRGQTKDKFIQRCMSDNTMRSEYPDSKQRYAVCNSKWEKKHGRSER